MWEFPGGKVESGETHQQALQREISEELGCEITVGDVFGLYKHAYTHFRDALCLLVQHFQRSSLKPWMLVGISLRIAELSHGQDRPYDLQ